MMNNSQSRPLIRESANQLLISNNQTDFDGDAGDPDEFELDDRFMFKLMSQLQKTQQPDSATSGLAMGLAN